METPTDGDALVQVASQAYVYGFPLVYGLHEIGAFVAGGGRFPMQAPYNAFGHARELAGPEFRFVSPNNDTCYSIAMCDVRATPLVLHVPDTADRYYVLQFVDAWSNNFAYIGRRATGTAAADYLLLPPGYDGPVPAGLTAIHAPTGVFAIVGRIQVDGHADLEAVHALQDAFTLAPLGSAAGDASAPSPAGVPVADPAVTPDLGWWERFRVALAAFPPPEADAPYLAACARLGLLDAASPYVDPDPALRAVLVAGERAGTAKVEALMHGVRTTPEGWQPVYHVFDYNLDHLDLGTIDSPEWTIADRATAYATRAVAARAGLWGNHGYEAAYASAWADGDGAPLTGASRYELHLPAEPPVDAFWSLTMYDVPDFYLVANPIDRYSIGDRTPGLVRDADGGLTILIQHESPGSGRETNWLPAPAGDFRPLLRMYQPRREVLDGTYVLPATRRIG